MKAIYFLLVLQCAGILVFSQPEKLLINQKPNWQNLDFGEDSVYGTSLERAYRELLKHKIPDTVIVAVIDCGIDTSHNDIRQMLWVNANDKGADDDGNGYYGDRYGWNFLGNKNGKNIDDASREHIRVYLRWKNGFQSKSGKKRHGKQPSAQFELWKNAEKEFHLDSVTRMSLFSLSITQAKIQDSILRLLLAKDEFNVSDLIAFQPVNKEQADLKLSFTNSLAVFPNPEVSNKQYLGFLKDDFACSLKGFQYDLSFENRKKIIGDNYFDINDRFYGNSDVTGGIPVDCSFPKHGTHVSGIIGAVRNNGIGINGIINAVKILMIRAVPSTGDEYDKDIALAIRYAVDNGAKVINMSFGKEYSPDRKWVENAIRYAKKKDVLLVRGAGNSARNIDSAMNFPTGKFINGKKTSSIMITVGASGSTRETLIASFSNYGKESVDVFAPGSQIVSTIPCNEFQEMSGTSMAAPVVSGIAALLRSYYPTLKASQIKYIIESSVVKISEPVIKPVAPYVVGNHKTSMKELCKTGGIVNAYNAILLADKITSGGMGRKR